MAQSTGYDLPNYLGELFQKTEKPNAVLRLIGAPPGVGVNGGQIRTVSHWEFGMGVDYSLPAASQPAILEGAAATASQLAVTQSANVTQIFQEAVDLTYTKQSAGGLISGVTAVPGANGPLVVTGTLEWQIAQKVAKIARDMNYTFLRGAYQKPANNATARKTRGFRTAVSTNLFANGAVNRALTKTIFENALRDMVVNGAFNIGDRIVVLADGTQYAALLAQYETTPQLQPGATDLGVFAQRLWTRYGPADVVFEPDMAAGEIVIFRPEKCRVVALPVVADGLNKGILFAEPLAKVGSSTQYQVYGEFGIDYTHEIFHGVVDDLS